MLSRLRYVLVIVMILVNCSVIHDLTTQFDVTPQHADLVGDPIRGKEIFQIGVNNNAPPCSTCHLVREGGFGMSLAPNLHDIATTGSDRIESLSAEEYIRDSIINPENFVVSGFRVSMYPNYRADLSEQDIADLIAYLMTLSI